MKVPESKYMLTEKEFYMHDCILNEAAYAAYDGSKKDNLFRSYCVITDSERPQSVRWK